MAKQYDPDTFTKCSVPMKEADLRTALEMFHRKVEAIRAECLLQNVIIIVEHPVAIDGDDAVPRISFGALGDSYAAERMTAYAYGVAQAQREETILAVQKRGRKSGGAR